MESSNMSNPESEAVKQPKMIEIERKFVMTGDMNDRIMDAGGTDCGVVTLRDSYYDNENYILTKADFWLRQRNNLWELKMPATNREDMSTRNVTQYTEITNEKDILAKLKTILFSSQNQKNDDLINGKENEQSEELKDVPSIVEKFSLKPFAEFVTHRKNYRMNNEITVCIDEADFGFQVGEIEMMVACNEAEIMNDAIAQIDEVAQKLGFLAPVSVQGKMDAYLSAHRRNHYQTLIETGILKVPS